MKIEKRQELDTAVLNLIKSGDIVCLDGDTVRISKASNLSLQLKVHKDDTDRSCAFWVLVSARMVLGNRGAYQELKFFALGHLVTLALDKLRNEHLDTIAVNAWDSNTVGDVNEVIAELERAGGLNE